MLRDEGAGDGGETVRGDGLLKKCIGAGLEGPVFSADGADHQESQRGLGFRAPRAEATEQDESVDVGQEEREDDEVRSLLDDRELAGGAGVADGGAESTGGEGAGDDTGADGVGIADDGAEGARW